MKKQPSVLTKVKEHYKNKAYCKITRKVGEDAFEVNKGYIVGYSKDLVMLQVSEDFEVLGYAVFPFSAITEVRYNNNDKYYDKIIRWEGEIEKVQDKYKMDLTDWSTVFKTIEKLNKIPVIECEVPGDVSFDIGPVIKVTKTAAHIVYFNASGILDEEPTKISWSKITVVHFDGRYENVFGKYLRQKNKRKKV